MPAPENGGPYLVHEDDSRGVLGRQGEKSPDVAHAFAQPLHHPTMPVSLADSC